MFGGPSLDTCAEVMGGIDQRQVRESLREVPKLAALFGIVFFREQPDVIAKCGQAFKECARVIKPVLQNVIIDQPEAAGEESAFVPR
jgi:hypothetical protein